MTYSPSELFTIEQAAVASKKSARTIARAISAGQLPFHRVGRRVQVSAMDLVLWIEGRVSREGEDRVVPNNDLSPLVSMPSVRAALEAEAAATDALIAWVRAQSRAKALKGVAIPHDGAVNDQNGRDRMNGSKRIFLNDEIIAILDGDDLILAQGRITHLHHRIQDQEMADETVTSFLNAADEIKARFNRMNCSLSNAQRESTPGLVNSYPCGEDMAIAVGDYFVTLVRRGVKVFPFPITSKKQNLGVTNFFNAIAEAMGERKYGRKSTMAELLKKHCFDGDLRR